MRKGLLIFICIIISLNSTYSQTKEERKEFKQRFLEAEYFFLLEEYDESAFLYNELLKTDPGNANLEFLVGASYLSIPGKKKLALPYLEKAVQNMSPGYREGSYKERNSPKECLFALARAYHISNRLDLAETYYKKYRDVMQLSDVAEVDYINKQMQSIELSRKMILDTVSISFSELVNDPGNKTEKYDAVYCEETSMLVYMTEKVFYSAVNMTRKQDGQWTAPVIINNQVELDGNIRLCSISFDGKELYFSKFENYNFDLYVSQYKDGRWTKAVLLSGKINTIYNETHAAVSKDNRTLYFTSDQPGGYGAMDIYVSTKDGDGNWGEAVNIGKPVNGLYSEETPFITADNKTLYFSSMSHATMGGYDVFYSGFLPDGKWSYPANLGYPISSNDDDLHYYPVNNGLQAIYSSREDIFDSRDMVIINPGSGNDEKLLALKGRMISNVVAENKQEEIPKDVKADENDHQQEAAETGTEGNIQGVITENLQAKETVKQENTETSGLKETVNKETTEVHRDEETAQHEVSEVQSGEEIVHIKPDTTLAEKSIELKGKLIPDDNAVIDPATRVELLDRETREVIATTNPDPETGEYSFDVKKGDYAINVESVGYDTVREDVSILPQHVTREVSVESKLIPEDVSSGKYVIAKNIFFRFDSYGLSEEAKFELEKMYIIMADNPEMVLELTGHTDSKGTVDYNLKLANRRSNAVRNYLISKGISEDRFVTRAVGEAENIAINEYPDGRDSPEGRRLNRQVEMKLINESGNKVWLEEYLVPDHLKPAARKKFYVILDDGQGRVDQTLKLTDEDIRLYETGRKHIYAVGSFANKRSAIEYLNDAIDTDFPEGRIVTEEEFNYLLQPSVPDLDKVKGPFTIQVLALKTPVKLESFARPGVVRQIRSSDGFYRYITGVYELFGEAQDSLVSFVLEGYTDAFIIPLSRFDTSLGEDEILPENYDYYFTIQFSASRKPAGNTFFSDIEGVQTILGIDGFYRYSTGIFLNKGEAERLLQEIRNKGYTDAFIRKVTRN